MFDLFITDAAQVDWKIRMAHECWRVGLILEELANDHHPHPVSLEELANDHDPESAGLGWVVSINEHDTDSKPAS